MARKKNNYDNGRYRQGDDRGLYRSDGFDEDPFSDDGFDPDALGDGGYRQDRYAGKPRKKKKKRRIWVFILELFLLALLALGVFLFSKLGQIEHEKLEELIFNEGAKTTGYRNFVLYGVDSREGELTKDCHSDTIMIVSLNKETKEVRLCSVYRDTYLDNTNGEFRKATECYFFGGPQRSINMLNKNLDLDITDYVAVNFNAVVKVVDMLDGIDLEITDDEMVLINGYCVENEQVTGASYTPLTTSGYVHLTGTQALAYCRIRYTEGWDFKRTERQRTVLGLVYQKAIQKGKNSLMAIADAMLPEISTSMNSAEILALVSSVTNFHIGEQTGFPFDQMPADLSDAGDCVVPVNLAANDIQLHQFLYGAVDYTPSATVQEISNQISSNTGIY